MAKNIFGFRVKRLKIALFHKKPIPERGFDLTLMKEENMIAQIKRESGNPYVHIQSWWEKRMSKNFTQIGRTKKIAWLKCEMIFFNSKTIIKFYDLQDIPNCEFIKLIGDAPYKHIIQEFCKEISGYTMDNKGG